MEVQYKRFPAMVCQRMFRNAKGQQGVELNALLLFRE
jgi:hypothetical protein